MSIDPDQYIDESGRLPTVDWIRLGRDVINSVVLAMFSGVIATIIAIRNVATSALEGLTNWLAERIIPLVGGFPERMMRAAIPPEATDGLSIFALVGGIAAVLASYYVFAWGVSKAVWE